LAVLSPLIILLVTILTLQGTVWRLSRRWICFKVSFVFTEALC